MKPMSVKVETKPTEKDVKKYPIQKNYGHEQCNKIQIWSSHLCLLVSNLFLQWTDLGCPGVSGADVHRVVVLEPGTLV